MVVFTPEQQTAIYADNPELLVSAAAGSGKTAVLVERIVRLVLEGQPLRRMLIVTFTTAAAGEMRQRLNRRLKEVLPEDPMRVTDALEDLEATDISTIHGFCRRFLKREFQAAGLDPAARVCRTDESDHLFAEAAHDALNTVLEREDGAAKRLTVRFSVKDVLEMNERLYRFLMSISHPYDWLSERVAYASERPVKEGRWYCEALLDAENAIRSLLAEAERYFAICREPMSLPVLEKTIASDRSPMLTVRQYLEHGKIEEAILAIPDALVRSATAKNLDPDEAAWHNRWKAAREELKKTCAETLKTYGGLLSPEEDLSRELDDIADSLQALAALSEETHRRFRAMKAEERLLDFSDLEQITFDLLSDPERPELREAWQRSYDHIFVDECQDVSQIQNDILMALGCEKNHRFLVGDVKQSIYRFRMANPTLFLERVRTYSTDRNAGQRAVFLTRNFRSAGTILDAANAVFERAMHRDITELDYTPEDRLVKGRTDEEADPVEVRFFETGASAKGQREAERALALQAIRRLIGQPKPGGGVYTYRDIAILMPIVAGEGLALTEALREQGVPVYYDGQDDFMDLPEIRAAHALMTLIDRPDDEIALLSVLRGAPFDFTDEELAAIRRLASGRKTPWQKALDLAEEQPGELGEKVRKFRATLAHWRSLRGVISLYDLLWRVLDESELLVRMTGRPGAELRLNNLRLLCEKAADFEATGGTSLGGFLDRLSDEMRSPDMRSARELGEDENLVRVMTVHKSKGLEFPAVILLGLNRQSQKKAEGAAIHRDLGLCVPCVNRDLGVKRHSFAERLITGRRDWDERAERCRLLYVAMTRARERLIVCAAGKELPLWREPAGDDRLCRSESMLDWLMEAVFDLEGTASPFRFVAEIEADLPETDAVSRDIRTETWRNDPPATRLNWLPPLGKLEILPRKTSVTSLARKHTLGDPMPLDGEDEGPEDKRVSERIVSPMQLSPIPAEPAWRMPEESTTGAGRGTANHRFLSLVDLGALRQAKTDQLLSILGAEFDRLRARDVISRDEALLISLRQAAGFFASELGQAFLHGTEQRREWGFNLRLSGTGTLLQGVIDAAFRTPEGWVIIDYKTDRIEDETAFVQRHAEQLNWYAEALRRITGQPVQACWLWSLSKGKAYPVEIKQTDVPLS